MSMKGASASAPTSVRDDMFVAGDIIVAPSGGVAYGMAAAAAPRIHGFPLFSTITMNGGAASGMTMTMAVTSISTQPLPPSTFLPPAGYKELKGSNPLFMPGAMGTGGQPNVGSL
jgi:hypothetical protein